MMPMRFNKKESIKKIHFDKLNYQVQKQTDTFNHDTIDKLNLVPKQYSYKQIISKTQGKDQNVFMSLNIPPPIIAPDKHMIYIKQNILKITNVYQPEYANYVKATGLGDFIRGTYFIMQFCEKYQIEYDMHINHPINQWLQHHNSDTNTIANTITDTNEEHVIEQVIETIIKEIETGVKSENNNNNNYSIAFYDKSNFDMEKPFIKNEMIDDFLTYLKDLRFEKKMVNIYTISFLLDQTISEKHKQSMIYMLEPTIQMKDLIKQRLQELRLVAKKYIVIHIRSGDQKLIYNEDISNDYLKQIVIEISKIYRPNYYYNYLLLSDSIELKKKIITIFPNIKVSYDAITHCGEGLKLIDENLKNTVLDFYLMAYSARIFSYSCYLHGTGFSKWCAETFSIPYKCIMVK
jgi:hypothetical protein